MYLQTHLILFFSVFLSLAGQAEAGVFIDQPKSNEEFQAAP